MLKIEVYCSYLLMLNFIVSMLGSLTYADINCVYSLFAFYAIYTHPQYNSIREVLIVLMIVTLIILLSDIWALALLTKQPIPPTSRIFGFIWVGL